MIDIYDLANNKWKLQGACQGLDADIFFPDRGASTRLAKTVCRRCDVQEECLEYAVNNREKFGIWGGLSERERRAIRKKRAVVINSHRSA